MKHVPDPYRLLGVARGATDAQIKAAHRTLAKRYHPDAPTGDTVRFLQVQEAYDVLSNPLRRREWDARHSTGPMRAGQAAPPRPRAANGRWTRAEEPSPRSASPPPRPPDGPRERPQPPGRDPSARSYTWSASEVPWWEERGPRENRRQPGRQRPPASDAAGQREAAHDFDVYNRSSGAAWSSAARAYFRRGEAELPRRGSFQRQGTQPLTAARARAAAEEEARRAQRAREGPPAPGPGTGPRAAPGASHKPPPPAARSSAAPGGRSAASPERGRESAGDPVRRGRPASGPPQPAYAWAGVARDAQSIASARAAAREASSSRWPTLSQRLAYALLAWLPVAVLIGYAGSVVTGCDRASVACPPHFEAVQSVLIALSLGLLVALPRLAYVAALGAAGLIVAAMALVLGAWFAGIRPPLPTPILAVVGVVLAIVYLATASWALADGPRRRPWASGRRRPYGARW